MHKKLLVMGIDPGTTVGYAILDVEGKIVEINSKRELFLSSLINISLNHGKVLAVGTDKKNVPGFIENFSAKTGALKISPDHDLLVSEKKEMVEFETKNHHEFDALASAVYAYNSIKTLLRKIRVFAEKNSKKEIEEKIIEFVVKQGISIRGAVDLIEKPEHEEELIIKKVIEKKQISESDFVDLYNSLKKIEYENKLLQMQSRNQQKEIIRLRSKHHKLSERTEFLVEEKSEKFREFRQAKLDFLSNQIRKFREEASNYKAQAEKFVDMVNSLDSNMVVKFLEDLSWEKFSEANKILKIKKGDVIYVENTAVVSKKTIDYLIGRVEYIIYKKPLSRMLEKEHFIFLDSSKLQLKRFNSFFLLSRQDFERETRSRDVVQQILAEYRKERKL